MLALLFAMASSAAPAAAEPVRPQPASPALSRASGRASVVIMSAAVVPMSGASAPHDRQTVRTLRLSDGEHQAIIVEFE